MDVNGTFICPQAVAKASQKIKHPNYELNIIDSNAIQIFLSQLNYRDKHINQV